jgi:hypothetical protein
VQGERRAKGVFGPRHIAAYPIFVRWHGHSLICTPGAEDAPGRFLVKHDLLPGMLDASSQTAGRAIQAWAGSQPLNAFRRKRDKESPDYSFVCDAERAGLPLEDILAFPEARYVYRTPEPHPDAVVQWLRQRITEPTRLLESGPWGLRDEIAMRVARNRLEGATITSRAGRRRLALTASLEPVIMHVTADAAVERASVRGLGAAGRTSQDEQWPGRFFRHVPGGTSNENAFALALKETPFDVIWLSGDLESLGSEIAFRVQASKSISTDPTRAGRTPLLLTPDGLGRMVKQVTRGLEHPFVILDVNDDSLRGRLFVLRNRFAHALYLTKAVRAVLATGFVEGGKLGEQLETMARLARAHACEGELLNALKPLCTLPPALYSYDATIPFV